MRLHAFYCRNDLKCDIYGCSKDYIGTHLYVGLISLAAVVGLLIIGACSANMKVHLTLLLLGQLYSLSDFYNRNSDGKRIYCVS